MPPVDIRNNNDNVETQSSASQSENNANGNGKGVASHPFTIGDQMLYKGYATVNGTEVESQPVQQAQDASENFTLQFIYVEPVDGQPCPGAVTLTDVDGNVYKDTCITGRR